MLGNNEKKHYIINHILFATKQCIYENRHTVNHCKKTSIIREKNIK